MSCIAWFIQNFMFSLFIGGGGGAPSPELAKLQATVGDLADKIDAVNEKVDGGGAGVLGPLAPGAKAGPVGTELGKMEGAIQKLAEEVMYETWIWETIFLKDASNSYPLEKSSKRIFPNNQAGNGRRFNVQITFIRPKFGP